MLLWPDSMSYTRGKHALKAVQWNPAVIMVPTVMIHHANVLRVLPWFCCWSEMLVAISMRQSENETPGNSCKSNSVGCSRKFLTCLKTIQRYGCFAVTPAICFLTLSYFVGSLGFAKLPKIRSILTCSPNCRSSTNLRTESDKWHLNSETTFGMIPLPGTRLRWT